MTSENSPLGPLIPNSTNFKTNAVGLLKIEESIQGTSFTDGTAVLTGGRISNMNDPVSDDQGATRAYTLANILTGTPGAPDTSVQFNSSSVFDGSANLTASVTDSVMTVMAQGMSVYNFPNITTMGGGTFTFNTLTDPTEPQDSVTKSYIDNTIFFVNSTVDNTAGISTYAAADMINGIINRSSSGEVVDVTATAEEIVAAVSDAKTGKEISFAVKNVGTYPITISAGADVTINNGIAKIYPGYQYNGIIVLTCIYPGLETASIYNISCGWTNVNSNFKFELNRSAVDVNLVTVTDWYTQNLTFDDETNTVLTISDIESKTIFRGPYIVPTTISLSSFSNFTGTPLNPKIWDTSGIDFYIVNKSTVVGANITIISGNRSPWVVDPNSDMIIKPEYTGWFFVYMVPDLYVPANSVGYIYTIGTFPTNP